MSKIRLGWLFIFIFMVCSGTAQAEKKPDLNAAQVIERAEGIKIEKERAKYLHIQAKNFLNRQKYDDAVEVSRFILSTVDEDSTDAKSILKQVGTILDNEAEVERQDFEKEQKQKRNKFVAGLKDMPPAERREALKVYRAEEKERDSDFLKQKWQKKHKACLLKADLVFNGHIMKIELGGAGVSDAVVRQAATQNAVTFKIDKIVQGAFGRDEFRIWVKSPAVSFLFNKGIPYEYEDGDERIDRQLYFKKDADGLLEMICPELCGMSADSSNGN